MARTILALDSSPESIARLIDLLGDDGQMVQITASAGFFVGTLGELAARKLGSMGNAAIGPLKETLSSHDAHARMNALSALGELNALDVTPDIVFALSDSDAQVREAAARTLREFELRRLDLIPVLTRNVRNHPTEKNPAVAFAALDYLGFLDHPDAIAFLRQAAQSRDDRLSYNARQTLAKYAKQSTPD